MATVKYSGPIASFRCPTNADIRSLKVHFSPKQEGIGDPSPENVRPIVGWDGVEVEQRGKNLIDLDESKMISDGWNRFFPNPIKKSGIYSISCSQQFGGTGSLGSAIFFVDEPKNNAEHIGDALVGYDFGNTTFQAANKSVSEEQANAKYILFGMMSNGCTFELLQNAKIQIEEGLTATSYEPYHGSTTNYEFGVLGKNKLPITSDMEIKSVNTGYDNTLQRDMTPGILYPNVSANNYWLGTSAKTFVQEVQNGSITFQANDGSYGIGTIVPVQPQATYTISYTTSDNQVRMRIGCYDADGYFTGTHQVINNGASFTVPNDTYHVIIVATPNSDYYNQSITVSNLQLELGSTATVYEPYDPNHTVYGGWVDLISGEVSEEDVLFVIDEDTPIKFFGSSHGTYKVSYNLPNTGANANAICCNYFGLRARSTASSNYPLKNKMCCLPYNTETIVAEFGMPDEITTQQDWIDWLTENGVIEVIYPIATPNTYHLAPTQLQTFLGKNNVWYNADYVEVEYDLHETQDILNRKQFIIANQPHIVKPVAASLQNFVTDMAAPLKECKVYFEPIQAGTGNPSFDNVRTISGWSKLLIGLNSKNLANPNDTEYGNYTISPTGEYISDSNRRISSGFISCSEKMHISLSANRRMSFSGIAAFDKNRNYLGRYAENGGSVRKYITPLNTQYIRFFTQDYTTPEAFADIQLQVELNENPTDYEPYTGTTSPITFPPVTNILNSTTITTNKTLSAEGEEISESGMSLTDYIKVNKGDTYKLTFTSKEGARTRRIWSYNASKEPIEQLASVSWVTVDTVGSIQATIPSGAEYIRICYKTADENIFLEGPESSVIYGGYVDLVTGEVWETHKKISITQTMAHWNTWGNSLVYNTGIMGGSNKRKAGTIVLCDYLTPIGGIVNPQYVTSTDEIRYYGANTTYPQYLFMANPDHLTIQEWRSWLKTTYPNAHISFELETPVLVTTLTPTQLKTLKGINNIWSDANGPIEVKYWTH